MIDVAFEHWWNEHWWHVGIDPNVESTVKAFARLAFADGAVYQRGTTEDSELRAACLKMVKRSPTVRQPCSVVLRKDFERVAELVKTRPLVKYRYRVCGKTGKTRNVAPPPTGTAENGA